MSDLCLHKKKVNFKVLYGPLYDHVSLNLSKRSYNNCIDLCSVCAVVDLCRVPLKPISFLLSLQHFCLGSSTLRSYISLSGLASSIVRVTLW